jgi:3-keto-5-aminohexanoate cleavage enzyme
MVARRADSPHVPLSVEEIVADGAACAALGATMLHLHARRADGSPAWERAAFREIVLGLRERCPEAVLCVTTSGREVGELDKRADVLDLDGDARPDMASLTLGSLNFRTQASTNAPDVIVGLARAMAERGIRPELEVFDTGMAYLARELLHREVIAGPLYANVLLGGPNTAPATAGDLARMVDALPAGTTWGAAGLGSFQLAMNAIAIFMGGHVRTGLEDSLWLDAGRRRPATNRALVERVAGLAAVAGRPLASAAQTRARLGLAAIATATARVV